MSYHLNISTGLIDEALYYPSPNFDERKDVQDISLIVIHSISLPPDQFEGNAVIDFFQNNLDKHAHPYYLTIKEFKVSTHLFIRRDGSLIQFVPLHKRAWHAGKSEFAGRSHCNDFSIGIELEGSDTIPYTSAQYKNLSAICLLLMQQYDKINHDHVVGHSDIAPGRKTDPGTAFDWNLFWQLLKKESS